MKLVNLLRFTCGILLFYTTLSVSVTITWQTLVSLVLFFVSFYVLGRDEHNTTDHSENALKKKFSGKTIDDLGSEQIRTIERAVCQFVTYDAEATQSLHDFELIKQQSQCLFARQARLWGSHDWIHHLSLEENIERCIPTFFQFTLLCPELGLDGFLFKLPEKPYAGNIGEFRDAVRRVLTVVSDRDPAHANCMNKSYIGKKEWVFEFNRMTFFITTFAPFYPDSHPRYAFQSDAGFILLQPELSFAFKDLPPASLPTNWDNPQNVRDRIRKAFRDADRPYHVRDTIHFPMSEDIVMPISNSDPVIEWWLKPASSLCAKNGDGMEKFASTSYDKEVGISGI